MQTDETFQKKDTNTNVSIDITRLIIIQTPFLRFLM